MIDKYNEWLKIFPFELPFFRHLKSFFENQIPIIDKIGETNIYTGMTGFKLKTKKELLGFLVSTTGLIIKEINTRNLYEKKLLSEVEQLQMEILMAKRKLELEKFDKIDWKDRKEYIKLLKSWLKGEKSFLLELKPLIKNINQPVTSMVSQTIITVAAMVT